MKIYPAIDIQGGRCVRLVQGDFKQVSVYDQDPANMAKRWQAEGAEYLHIVDLDGARYGAAHSDEIVKRILKSVDIPVQIGGGIRSMEDISNKLDMGITRVILGTAAIRDPRLTADAAARYGDRIVVGVDAADGKAAIQGWTEVSECTAAEMISELGKIGVQTIVYTDVSKDGMMEGPNIPMYAEIAALTAAMPSPDIIAAGGVSTIADVQALKATGIHGAIIGKALYIDEIDLAEAMRTAEGA